MADISTEDQLRVIQFGRNIMPLAQQSDSVLFDAVMQEGNVTGKSYTAEQIGEWDMVAKGGRHTDTPISDPRLGRRVIDMKDYENAVLLDKEDSFKMLADPMSAYSIAGKMSTARQVDKVIITAFDGDAKYGENGENTETWSSTYDVGTTSTTTGLSGVKVKQAKLSLDNNNVPEEDRYFVTTPTGIYGLLNEDEVTSSDYNTVKALVYGQIDSWLGFKFLKTTLLGVSTVNTVVKNFAFHKTAMSVGLATGPFTRITERDDKSFAKQLYYSLHIGAGRVEMPKMVRVYCKNVVASV